MEINITQSTTSKINLPDHTVYEITSKKLKQMLYPGQFLRRDDAGKLIVKKDEDNWRHGSVSEDYVRDATELDIAIFKVLDALYDEIHPDAR